MATQQNFLESNGNTANGDAAGAAAPEAAKVKRRSSAEVMATKQKEISVSEFFVKNRHLLGFDNPRKALLTTIKEAVDNSLDACEEAGILPEIWVHIEQTGESRYKIGVQDNGPGILKSQIPNIFGKLLYGSKFHRLRQSRGQQGIGISAAGMYGLLTTGKPVKIISKTGPRKPAHYYELQIDTKRNKPEILNGKGEGIEVPLGDAGAKEIAKHEIEWIDVPHGTRVTIELEAKFHRGRGSVDDYLEQTAIANPHVTLHYLDPDNTPRDYPRAAEVLPPEAKEIKPHPYGIELGMLINMLKDCPEGTLSQFLTNNFSRVSPSTAAAVCGEAKLSSRAHPKRIGRHEAETLFKALQISKISSPETDCLVPIGEQLMLKGLHHVVPAEFYVAFSRPPAVYRGNPFAIEVALAFGGTSPAQKVTRDALKELLAESDARTLRQFLTTTFSGIGPEGANRILKESSLGTRSTPSKLKPKEIASLHEAMQNVNLQEGQTMNVLRYANRVPLLFQPGACAITQTVANTNWRAYGLTQSRGSLPSGPVTVFVHIASVWVPFTSESKEAVAAYPDILKELRLGLQSVGRKLGTYLNRRQKVKAEGERRQVFLRYLGKVADTVSQITGADRNGVFDDLHALARKKTSDADVKFDESGKAVAEVDDLELGDNVLIVPSDSPTPLPPAAASEPAGSPKSKSMSKSDESFEDDDEQEDD